MGETTPKTDPTIAAPSEADREAGLERTALQPPSHAPRFLRLRRLAQPGPRHALMAALLMGLLLALAFLIPLSRVFSSLSPQSAAATATASPMSPEPTPTEVQSGDWPALRARPLYFPTLAQGATCPVSPVRRFSPGLGLGLGDGPVYPFPFQPDGELAVYSPPQMATTGPVPGYNTVFWAVAPTYYGDVLVRGAQLDGHHPVRFNGGYLQQQNDLLVMPVLNELDLTTALRTTDGWAVEGTYIRLEAPGCYAVQVDGMGISYVLVFRAGMSVAGAGA